MSNHLFSSYGRPMKSLWFPGLIQFSCRTPKKDLTELDQKFPLETAIYFLCQNRGIAYIGISGEHAKGGLFKRLRTHWQSPKKTFEFCYAFGLPPSDLGSWEKAAIKEFQPEENRKERNYKKPVNDDLYGLPSFVETRQYFEIYPDRRIFRVDTRFG